MVAAASETQLVLLLLDDKPLHHLPLEGKIALADILQPELMETSRYINQRS